MVVAEEECVKVFEGTVPADSDVRFKNAVGPFKGRENILSFHFEDLMLEGAASGTIVLGPTWIYPHGHHQHVQFILQKCNV